MLDQSVYDLVLRLLLVYALVGAAAALGLVAALAVVRAVVLRPPFRTAFWALFLASVTCVIGAYGLGVLRSPGGAAKDVTAKVESENAFSARSRNIVPTDAAPNAGVVYIQAPDMDARFAAEKLWRALKTQGLASPGIELAPTRSPARPEVRYFNEADKPLADRIAGIAAAEGVPGAVVVAVDSYKAPAGQIEFWYPRSGG
jgi:hypothetical protein